MGRTLVIVMALVAALLSSALTGCSIRTAGAPQGSLVLKATFDDVQGLVAGHSVQMSDVKIGTVTKVELDRRAYTATATLSITDGHRIPQGTRAEIKVTSLLGENYVDLILPPGGSMDRGPFLAAGAAALDGNGRQLNVTIAKSTELLQVFTVQRNQLAQAVDQFAKLGRSLARGGNELNRAPVELERTTRLLNDNKEKILNTVQRLTTLAHELNDKVLEGRVQRFRGLLRDLDPVLAQLGGNRARLTALVNGLVTFESKLPRASYDGQLLLYPILKVTWPDGTPVLPSGPNDGGSGGNGGLKLPELPRDLRGALPDLDDLLRGPR